MTIQLAEKKVNGMKIRTNNTKVEEIIQLWNKVSQLPLDGEIYAIYSNYTSNFNGDYDLLIGNETINILENSTIQAGKYSEISLGKATPDEVGRAWQKIWEDDTLERKRTYLTDFEHYKTDRTVSIYLGIK